PFDAHLLDRGWKQTRGQQSCPTGAMRAIKVEDEDMARLAREQDLEVLKPELGARPRVYYRNLWRYSKCFIGGSVAEERQGVVECVEGASVQLVKDGASLAVTTTDNFGDFKFDRLDEESGSYSIQIFSGGLSKVLQVNLGTSVSLGEIRI
ncbi:MAG TPA: oxidoreductase, partial [Xanthobacteraceae bacterium]